MAESPRVLHVVEAFGGGVADAVSSFVESSPGYEHHLLYSLREGITVDESVFDAVASARQLPRGHVRRVLATRDAIRRTRPAVVHAHSSFGGVYSRAAISSHRVPIVYSPHCFSFERRDISGATRRAYRAIERILAPNTTVFACCSDRERALALRLSARPVRLVVNVARTGFDAAARPPRAPIGDAPLMIAMTGRLAPQKGVGTFARLAGELAARGVEARVVWIGGGEMALAAPLLENGIEVTGWLSAPDVSQHLAEADLYVHTAEWEGFPVGLLEAVARGVPSLVLDRPYAEGMPSDMIVADDELADRVESLIRDASARARLAETNAAALAMNTSRTQSAQLESVYAMGRASLPQPPRRNADSSLA